MATTATNQSTGLSYKFIRFDPMAKEVATTYRNVFGAAGSVYAIYIRNEDASADLGLIKFYDTIAAVTVAAGVTDVSPSLILPFREYDAGIAGSSDFTSIIFPEGLAFSNGLAISIAKDVSTNYGKLSATNLAADVTDVVIAFK